MGVEETNAGSAYHFENLNFVTDRLTRCQMWFCYPYATIVFDFIVGHFHFRSSLANHINFFFFFISVAKVMWIEPFSRSESETNISITDRLCTSQVRIIRYYSCIYERDQYRP